MRNKHIKAEIIADSLTERGERLTSFVVTVPRIVLAEFNTHRMLSRNSASSRAIPFDTMVEKVMAEPFLPIKWQKDHKGMQGTEYFESEMEIEYRDKEWLKARDAAVKSAKTLNKAQEVTKQFCNRLLEPFLYHTIIVTASEWQNFFALRAHEAAEIHIQDLAFKMLEEYNKSTPKLLKEGEWHIPFGDTFDEDRLGEIVTRTAYELGGKNIFDRALKKIKIATARCARVSYLNYEGGDDYEKDIKLHDRLSSMGHWSPFEHCARAMSKAETEMNRIVIQGKNDTDNLGWSGNLKGFIQYRKLFDQENKKDNRVIKK